MSRAATPVELEPLTVVIRGGEGSKSFSIHAADLDQVLKDIIDDQLTRGRTLTVDRKVIVPPAASAALPEPAKAK